MDFVKGFPAVGMKSMIVVVVDRLSNYYHLGALPETYSAMSITNYFVHQIVRLHGMPKTINFDHYKIFMSKL